jgi:PhnB protein
MFVQPYLIFNGRCEEAIEFYKKALGAKVLMLMHFKDSPDKSMTKPADMEKVMHSALSIGDTVILASDGHNTGVTKFEGFSMSITVPVVADAEKMLKAVSEGGQVQMPLTETFFAKGFGMAADKFGVVWMFLAGPKNP